MHQHDKHARWFAMRVVFLAGAAMACLTNGFTHHSFSAVFDAQQPVELTGTVTRVEWMNPHTWFYINVDDTGSAPQQWALELGSPNNLIRHGWTRDSLRVGQVVKVAGYRARDGSSTAAVREVTLASGEALTGGQQEAQ